MLMRVILIYRMFFVKRGGGCSKDYFCYVCLFLRLQSLCRFCGFSNTNQQHAGGKRIQSAGMSNFKFMIMKLFLQSKFDFSNGICACPSIWLVQNNNNPVGIIL